MISFTRTVSLILLGIIMHTTDASAQDTARVFTGADGVALKGYDVVNYFTANEARRGSRAHAVLYRGATFYFVNDANKQAFEANPEKYLPQYGGWCAFAMATQAARVPSDPETFKLRDGRLYLFFNDYYQGTPFNTIVPWNADEAELVRKANANWAQN
ncbi:YHS domain-containing (seleno)protein [Rhodocaloribacter sp.]